MTTGEGIRRRAEAITADFPLLRTGDVLGLLNLAEQTGRDADVWVLERAVRWAVREHPEDMDRAALALWGRQWSHRSAHGDGFDFVARVPRYAPTEERFLGDDPVQFADFEVTGTRVLWRHQGEPVGKLTHQGREGHDLLLFGRVNDTRPDLAAALIRGELSCSPGGRGTEVGRSGGAVTLNGRLSELSLTPIGRIPGATVRPGLPDHRARALTEPARQLVPPPAGFTPGFRGGRFHRQSSGKWRMSAPLGRVLP